ncbi:hypothetical protein EPUL_004953 [Erysiphe pulchra]|uniref:CCHC-type domain-containing protein n=1 Tax=Erysiphe pulchra TaxID=225359 RepID=A0A2S4PQQ3_9PEZI|nr:hypothetical protein EPUL_004953 [Erysiphe pulchra]
MYKRDIKKQEAEFIRDYIRKAIARLAASDNSPKPPLNPKNTKSRQTKDRFQEKDSEKKNNLPTGFPKPSKDTLGQNSWAIVARNGYKKSRVTMTIPIVSKNITTGVQKKPSTHSKSTMIKNTKMDQEWRNLSPAGLREVIIKCLAVSLASIGLIKPVRTGFAISPSNSGAREAFLQTKIGLLDTGAKLESGSNWVPLIVPTVPKFNRAIQGQTHYGTSITEAPHRTWIAYFDKAPRPGFRVFDESGKATVFKKQKAIDFCKRCNVYRPTRYCFRAPSCGNCGSYMHLQNDCKAFTKCKNCGGPHRSDSHKCLARSSRYGGPTKEQLKSFRIIGEAKVAEQRATAVTESIVISSSQSSEPSSSDIQQTPFEAPLDEQMRL